RRRRVADDAEVDRLLVFASTAKLITSPDQFLLFRQVAAVVLLKLLPGDYPIFVVVLEKPVHRRANLSQASLDGVQLPPGVVLWSRGHLFPPAACYPLRIGKRAYLGVHLCDEAFLVQRHVGTCRLILLGARDTDIADCAMPPMFHVAATAAETASEHAAQDTLARGRAAVDVVEPLHALGRLKGLLIDDRLVVAGEDALLPDGFPGVSGVGEDPVHGTISPYLTPAGCRDAAAIEHPGDGAGSVAGEILLENPAYKLRFFLMDHETLLCLTVADGRRSAEPLALAFDNVRQVVADTLADHFALKLGEVDEDVSQESPYGRRGINV